MQLLPPSKAKGKGVLLAESQLILQCSGNRPQCLQCLEHRRTCDWPEQLKRGPAKGYFEALERRLHETENLLLGLLDQVSDSQLSEAIPVPHHGSPAQLRSGKRGSEHWKLFPLRSVQEIRAWQEELQRTVPEDASTSNSTPRADRIEVSTPKVGEASAVPQVHPQTQRESPELQPSVSAWIGAPSINFQQQFLW
ncbi:hypothetical protein BDW74DRAFT_172788 [Aspergillus multicolor]|uniref:uncharacterized protein n=1 Tax=Aspergillus multicolor TaxID=41759 RepID=UPI003CCD3A83